MTLDHGTARSLAGAIEQCLAGCYRDESPVFRLNECLTKLRAQGYSDADLRRIELSVLKRLVGLMSTNPPADEDTVID